MRTQSAAWAAAFLVLGALGAASFAPSVALARVGDVLAIVDAGAVLVAPAGTPGDASPATVPEPAGRVLLAPASAALAGALADHGLDRIEGLGAPFAAAATGADRRLVLLSSPGTTRTQAEAAATARDLVARGVAVTAMADQPLKLAETIPNDTYEADQWWLPGTGGGVHVTQAWDVTKGSPSVVIGVIDTGVDLGHPDLATKIWTNPGEIPGNGIDDDGDGYVDDVHGWDFGDNDADPDPTPLFDSQGLDEAFHGTSVAGAAAAATNNSEGIAGVAWQSVVMPLKFSDSAGQTLASYAGPAMLYAIAKHADVLNMSWGAANPDSATQAFFQALVDQANAGNVVCVAAAGNDGTSAPAVPAACTGTLSVGSISESNARSSFSNYGSWVNIAAPGENLWTPICRNYTIDATSAFVYGFFFGYDGVNPYMFSSGTSLATPIVSGACALVRSLFPTARPFGVIQHMIDTGDNLIFDQHIGPKLNVFQAVNVTLGVGDLAATAGGPVLELSAARPTPFAGSTSLAYRLARPMEVRLAVFDVAGHALRTLARGPAEAGPHAVVWDGTDAAGRRAPAGIYFAVLEGAGTRATSRLVRTQ